MKVLVTGGGGFLGKAIVRQLLDQGYQVRSLTRSRYPVLEEWGVETHYGDIADHNVVYKAVEGCEAVIHTAAKAGIWGKYDDYYQSNVVGTEHVIHACLTHGVDTLVYTSSPSVVHGGSALEGVNESAPYPSRFYAFYPETKAMAEDSVLSATEAALSTVALRPHLIWGPGDNHFLPKFTARAKAGRLRFIGKENPLVDTVYIDNAAEAHILALKKLKENPDLGGKAYFISQDEPIGIRDWINGLLLAAGIAPVQRNLSKSLAYGLGWCFEQTHKLLRIEQDPLLTRYLVNQMSTAHYFDISAAKKDLGYVPRVSIEEGLVRLQQSLT